jgi:RNA polymerase sigma-70 factor, ECF subfamily
MPPNTYAMQRSEDVSDAQLITTLLGCADTGLAELYRRYGDAVYGVARRVLRSSSEAEDVTQEVFLRLWRHTRGSLRSFLLTQAHARAVDTIRTLNARRRREEGDAHLLGGIEYDIFHAYWEMKRCDYVEQALEDIPAEERVAIQLAYFDEHTYIEVAEILNQPEGTIKSRIRNGMRRMREALVDAGIQGVDA